MSAALKLSQDQIVERLNELPTLPTIVYELSKIIADPMSSTKEVEAVMGNDQSLTTKVLKLVNSAYYAIPGGVTNLGRAIAYIGFDTVHQLVLATSILKALEVKADPTFNITEFWKHSIGVGIAAETIAKKTRYPNPSDLFTCGLVHDMGKVALYTLDSSWLVEVIQFCTQKNLTFIEAESEMQGPKHTHVGKALAEKWRLPVLLQNTIQFHHQADPTLRSGLSKELSKAVDIVFLSNLLVHALKFGHSGYEKISAAPKEVMQRLGIDPEKDFKNLIVDIKKDLGKADGFIKIIGS